MTDVDRLSPTELRLRAELQRTLTPPPTPFHLLAHVEQLATGAFDEPARRRSPARDALEMGGRSLRLGLAAAAVLALLAATGLLVGSRIAQPRTATPHPTLPAFTGPALPSPVASPTRVYDGAWIDATTAWLVDVDQQLRITSDGGQTWSEPRPLPFTESGLAFFDAEHGYTTWAATEDGAGRLLTYRTSDGGQSWQSSVVGVVTHAPNESLLATVHYTDRLHGIALVATVVEAQVAFRTCIGFVTDDGGASWAELLPGAPCFLSVFWDDPMTGVVQPATGRGEVALTVDGGRSWETGTLPAVGEGVELWLQAVVDAGGGRVRLVGSYHTDGGGGVPPLVVIETGDGGRTWRQTVQSSLPDSGTMPSLAALDADHWLGILEVPTPQRPFQSTVLVETWDGGRTWERASDTGTIQAGRSSWADRLHGMLQGVDMGDCSDPVVGCGGSGTTFLTNDGGRTWHHVPF